MLFLFASIAALLAGPLLLALLGPRRSLLALIDGFVVVTLAGLVLLHVLPSSIELGGGAAAFAAGFGVLLPWLLERGFAKSARALHASLLWAAVAGLFIHAMLDGAALASEHAHEAGHGEGLLAAAVLIHRVPVGLTIWWAVQPNRGRVGAAPVLGVIVVATAAGFFGADALLARLPLRALATFQALVAGTLVHVVVGHQPKVLREAATGRPVLGTVGACLGAAAMLLIDEPHTHELLHGELGVGSTFATLAAVVAPPLVLALMLSSLISARPATSPHDNASWLQAGRGMLQGLLRPGVQRDVLGAARGPLGARPMAMLVAGGAMGADALFVSVPLLGLPLTLVRLGAVMLTAWMVGIVVGESGAAPQQAPRDARVGWSQTIEHALPWLLVGLIVAALIEPLLPATWLVGVPTWVQVVAMVAAGLPGPLTAVAVTPVAAMLMHKGLSPGATLAFTIAAPAANLALLSRMARMHGVQAFRYAIVVGALALGFGLLADQLVTAEPLPLHRLASEPPTPWELGASALLAMMLVISLLKRGPRNLLAHVFETHRHEHDDDHGHAHHEHG